MKRALVTLLLAGCAFGSPNREALGDAAWHEGRWADAVAAYRAAGDSPRVTAKLADAEMQAGALSDAAEAWTKVGTDEVGRAPEAAAGLARVADLAEQAGKQGAIASAIIGLHRIAPTWPVSRIASRLGRIGDLQPAQVADVAVALLAATPGRGATEPLLVALAQADRARGACDLTVAILEGVLRRSEPGAMRDSAATTMAGCELSLGLNALRGDHPGDAERWLTRAGRRDTLSVVGRRALVGLGDAVVRQGDSTTARQVWRNVITSGAVPDSVTQLALLRLAETNPVVPSDSTTSHQVRQ